MIFMWISNNYSVTGVNRNISFPSTVIVSANIAAGRTHNGLWPNSGESYKARYTTNSSNVSL